MKIARRRKSLTVSFPAARQFGAAGGKSAHIIVKNDGGSDEIAIRAYGQQAEIGCVVLRSAPKGSEFSIDCDWIPAFVHHFTVERIAMGVVASGAKQVIDLPDVRNAQNIKL